jgi:hypothetical protein
MRSFGVLRALIGVVVVSAMTMGPIASAPASNASITAVIESYSSRILVDEGEVVSAIGVFKQTHQVAGVQTAISRSVKLLSSLKSKLVRQSASSRRVKLGKAKFVKGLGGVVKAYNHLALAYSENAGNPQAAEAEATKAIAEVKKARAQLKKGAKLLG